MALTIDLGAVSSYAIALEHGYTGTEEEWLRTLQGVGVSGMRFSDVGHLIVTYHNPADDTYTEHDVGVPESGMLLATLAGIKSDVETLEESARQSASSALTYAESAGNSSSTATTAKNTAVAAMSTAESAKTDAQTAQTNAVKAQTAAETARDAAVSAQQAAEGAKGKAETAAQNAATAKSGAESAKDDAVIAKNNAVKAQTAAETARDAAVSAQQAAATVKTAVDQTAEAANTAKTDAVNAKNAAVSAKTAAETAKSGAAQIKSDIEGIKTEIENKATAVDENKTKAETAAAQAADAQSAATTSAQTAQTNAEKAVGAIERVESVIGASDSDMWWAARITNENRMEIFNQWFEIAYKKEKNLTVLLERWFDMLTDSFVYGVKFYKFEVSGAYEGEFTDSSVALGRTTPSTNTVKGTDPYAERNAFWAIEVAYRIVNKDVQITAIAGVGGCTREEVLSGRYGMVGVAQKTGWVSDTEDDNYYYHRYRTSPAYFLADAEQFKPLPECVRVDGTVRPFMVHAKYMAGRGADGLLTSASGLAAVNFISMQSQASEWRKVGADYSGISGCDLAFRMRMFWMKYARKGNSGTLEGCSSYNIQVPVMAAESGVRRVLINANQLNNFVVGSTVSVGDPAGNTNRDRGATHMRNIADKVRILSKETVDVGGTSYCALNLELDADISTTTTCYVSTMPWHSGSCDDVQGYDGSPSNCTNGKEPFIIQLLESQTGGYAIAADQLIEQLSDGSTYYTHRIAFFRQAAQITTSINSNAVRSPNVLDISLNVSDWSWQYQGDVKIDSDGNMYASKLGASSSTGQRAALGVLSAGSRISALWAWATLNDGGACGLSFVNSVYWAGDACWYGLAGACGTGANRGEYAG